MRGGEEGGSEGGREGGKGGRKSITEHKMFRTSCREGEREHKLNMLML